MGRTFDKLVRRNCPNSITEDGNTGLYVLWMSVVMGVVIMFVFVILLDLLTLA